jgi:hypothetical protein
MIQNKIYILAIEAIGNRISLLLDKVKEDDFQNKEHVKNTLRWLKDDIRDILDQNLEK